MGRRSWKSRLRARARTKARVGLGRGRGLGLGLVLRLRIGLGITGLAHCVTGPLITQRDGPLCSNGMAFA